MEIYHPVKDDANYEALMEKARATVKMMDKTDKKGGFATHLEVPLDTGLRTVIAAVGGGIAMQNWDCVAEGLVMLQEIGLKVRRSLISQSN